LVDVIPHATTGGRAPRMVRATLPALVVAIVVFGVALWGWWLHPGGVLTPAVAAAAGVVLAALLLTAPRAWAPPLIAGALAVGGAAALHDAPIELVIGHAVAVVAAAFATGLLLHWYARGRFQLTRVQELCTLVAAAAVGGVLGAALLTLAVAIEREPSADALWHIAWPIAIAMGAGLVLIPTAVLTLLTRAPASYLRGRDIEAALLVLALAVVAFAITQFEDPLVFAGAAVLAWAALRFGPAAVAWSGIVLVATADWSAARLQGPFVELATPRDAVVLLQTYAAITLFCALALAFALLERDRAEMARGAAVERFRRTFHDSPVAMAVTTLEGRITETNRALCQLLAMPDHALVGSELRALWPDDSGEHELPRPGQTDALPQEARLVNARGNVVWVEISESPLRRGDLASSLQVVVLRDVTERTNLRQQLLQAQKMESVARLAGGIAHDFNNVLSVMRGQVELLQDDLEVLESARARIDSVQRATDRAAALTDDLMAFSRQRDEPEPFDVHERLHDVQELFHQVLGAAVTLELDLAANPATIVADPNRIEQAVLNLVVNARDAMPAGGEVVIATRTDPITRAFVLSVSDTGAGMDAATRARIFEPFFTTKPPGFGTGLGLSTTDDIVRAAGGTIEVDSHRGRGTTFTVTFPALEEHSGGHEILDLVDDDTPTVLVVDDETDVRSLIAEILRGSGYHVVVAADGDAAIAILERATRPVDLLVTDVVMPVMSGTDLAARVTSSSPTTRVLFVSGFVPAGSPSLRGAPLVAKPLHRAELLDAVHLALDGAA
jgi:two-component system, cell cycle sensor histidine kinase and response regulator CckA